LLYLPDPWEAPPNGLVFGDDPNCRIESALSLTNILPLLEEFPIILELIDVKSIDYWALALLTGFILIWP
jgi:hypothetical protein